MFHYTNTILQVKLYTVACMPAYVVVCVLHLQCTNVCVTIELTRENEIERQNQYDRKPLKWRKDVTLPNQSNKQATNQSIRQSVCWFMRVDHCNVRPVKY